MSQSNTPYIKNFDKIRQFLQRFAYGSYTRKQLLNQGFSKSTYDECIRTLQEFLPQSAFSYNDQDRPYRFRLQGNQYGTPDNKMVSLYAARKIEEKILFFRIFLLQLLQKQPMKLSALTQKAEELLRDKADESQETKELLEQKEYDSDSFDRDNIPYRRIQELCAAGYVHASRENIPVYSIPASPFRTWSDTDLYCLSQITALYCTVSLFYLPGAYLKQHLDSLLSCTPAPIYQIRHSSFARIFDEPVLYTLLQAIGNHQKVKCTYHTAKRQKKVLKQGYPQKILTVRPSNQLYVQLQLPQSAQTEQDTIADIFEITIQKRSKKKKNSILQSASPAPDHRHLAQEACQLQGRAKKTITLQLQTSHPAEMQRIGDRLHARYADITTDTAGGASTVYHIAVTDPLHEFPFLRTLHPYIKVIDAGTPRLQKRFVNEMKEALTNYDS